MSTEPYTPTTEEPMDTTSAPTLTEQQTEMLQQCAPDEWLRPMDMGGRDGSHHSSTLRTLIRKGLVERKPRTEGWRGSYLYRRTPAGNAYITQETP